MRELNLVTYNIQHGINSDAIVKNICKLSRLHKVDIFCLQEAHKKKDCPFVADIIQEKLGHGWQIRCIIDDAKSYLNAGECFLWKSSELRLVKLRKLYLPHISNLSLIGKTIRTGRKPTRRSALIGIFNISNIKVKIINLHLGWQGGVKHRLNQLNYLVHKSNNLGRFPAEIICGDFNTIGFPCLIKNQKQKINAILGPEFQENSRYLPWTCDMRSLDNSVAFYGLQKSLLKLGINFRQKLDYIFSKGFRSVKTRIEMMEGSDHFPIIASFRV